MYKKKLFEGPSMRGKTIGLIINTLHEKNNREEQHSHRVSEICEKLANTLQMPDHEMKVIRNAGLLHDIGKIAISENLLNKPGKLTPEEFEEITRHPEIGYRILCSANEMTDMAEYVLSHHERWDGKGYPRGLSGEDIPLQSRMIAIADTFDAMTSVRSYRLPVSEEEAAKEILRNAGTQFDPELAQRFVHETLGYQF
jgi:putative nucleotidyltransferase with HDIG domain